MKKISRFAWVLGLALLLAGGSFWLAAAQQVPPKEEKQGPLQPKPSQEEEAPYALKVDVPLVNVDLTVVDRNGNFVTGLQKEHFRVYEDGAEQEIVAFAPSEAPLTTVLVVETTPAIGYLVWDNLDAAYYFLRQIRKGDWVGLVSFDFKPRVEVDFTQDSQEIYAALRRLAYPAGFRESNTFDAIADTLDRMKDIEGKKSIIVIGTGVNSFSRHSWDDIQKLVREHRAVIFGIGMSFALQMYYERREAYGISSTTARMNLQIADVQLRALSEQTGGRAYFPRFITEMPGIYQEIGGMLRNQYSVAFRPRELKRDGKFHKIQIKLVGPDGKPLKVVDQNGKQVKYEIYAREGYYAPQA
ncbi:MAG: VWA domain-containing protein [Acidobacteria bacterium]|nr:VWA domain-containing protein [Acidobacteriota bacterium]